MEQIKIIKETDLEVFVDKINTLLEEGYFLHGTGQYHYKTIQDEEGNDEYVITTYMQILKKTIRRTL